MVLRQTAGRLWVLLIQRKNPPYQFAWALPGGFVDRDEDALAAGRRELREETGLRCRKLVEFGSFSRPDRDPRGRTVTIAYYTVLLTSHGEPEAGDDAGQVQWFPANRLPRLAFDHREMIQKGLQRYRHDLRCKML